MEDGKAANDESKTKTLEIGSTGEVLPAVNADLVGTQQHLFRKREQIQQDEHLKDGTWGQYDNGVGSGGQSPDRNNQNGDGTDGLGSDQKDNDNSDQGVSLLGSGYNPLDTSATMNSFMHGSRGSAAGVGTGHGVGGVGIGHH